VLLVKITVWSKQKKIVSRGGGVEG